jgi:copper transport protein
MVGATAVGPSLDRVRIRPVARATAAALAAALALTVGAALLVGDASPAGAHATLIGTSPTADAVIDAVPELVELRFDEPVETTDGAIEVFGPDGERVDLGTVDLADGGATVRAPIDAGEASPGTYTVAWRVTSEDSHTLSGSFVFHDGTRTGAVDVDQQGGETVVDLTGGIGRWLGLVGTLTAVGAAAVAMLGAPRPGTARRPHDDSGTGPGTDLLGGDGTDTGTRSDIGVGTGTTTATGADALSGSPAPEGRGVTATLTAPERSGGATAADGPAPASARLRLLTVAGALAGAVGTFVALVAVVAESAGRSLGDALTLVPDLAPESRTGQLALLRIAFGLAAGAAASVAALWRRTPVPALLLGAAALVTASLAGHAWTAPNRWVAVASDVAHVGSIAVWIGGLVALLVALPLLATAARVRLATRFSGLAVAAVVVVAVSGSISGWQQVRALDALTSTTYGRLLLAKVAGFALLVALGWVNRSRLVPLVERTVAPLRRSLRAETLIAALVLAVTAALIQQPPARTVPSDEPFDTTATADGGEVVAATVDPAVAGANDIHLYFYEASGTDPLPVDAVQVSVGTADVPARVLPVTPVTTNHVTVSGASLPSAGTWTVEVTAVQAGRPLTFTFEVPIA